MNRTDHTRRYTTADGIEVHVDGWHMGRTYAGLLEGAPNIDVNQFLLNAFKRGLEQQWGPRPTLIRWPQGATPSLAPELPAWTCALWASATFAPSEDDDGSELVVIWFEASLAHQPLETLAAAVLAQVPWRQHAGGCGF